MATFAEVKQNFTDLYSRWDNYGYYLKQAFNDSVEFDAGQPNADALFAQQRDDINEKLRQFWDVDQKEYQPLLASAEALDPGPDRDNLVGQIKKQFGLSQNWIVAETEALRNVRKSKKMEIDRLANNRNLQIATSQVNQTTPSATTPQPAATAGVTGAPVNLSAADQRNLSLPGAGTAQTPTKSEPSVSGSNNVVLETTEVTAKGFRPNVLHSYASYTYGLSLHLLTIEDYNQIVDTGTYSPKNVLIASAGRYNEIVSGTSAFARNPEFSDDFYFSNLNMTTVIGMGEHNRSTNAIDIDFTIIEPYGLTLLDRLLNASEAVFSTNYLENPYLLQIDFFGTDDAGNIQQPIPNITKRIPIKILSMDIKMGANGAEYKVSAMPFNHQAFTESIISTPINLEITAGTVNGFFKATLTGANDLAQQINDAGGERTQRGVIIGPDGQETPAPTALFSPTRIAEFNKEFSKDQVYTARSYADALNAYKIQQQISQVVLVSDRYDFKFDTRIGNSPLFADEKSVSPNELKMADVSTYSSVIAGNQGAASAALNLKQRKFPIRQGSSIESVIHHMVKNSQYIVEQMKTRDYKTEEQYVNERDSNKNKPLEWIKIIPSIKLIGFDPFTNSFAKEITYNVVPYEIRNVRFDEAPQGKARIEDAVKLYQYIYTGENDDILDLNIELNAMYYTTKTTYRSNLMRVYGVDGYYNNVTANGDGTCDVAPPAAKTITPNQIKYRHTDKRHISAGGSKTAQEIAAADLSASLASMAQADMLSVDLKIIGDPDFIKQDDIFYKPAFNANGEIEIATRYVTPNGSIVSDTQDVIVLLEFKTPTDIDDTNGLMKFDTRYKASGFSGFYRVLTVMNNFENGRFTQTLHLIRLPNQDDGEKNKGNNERNETAGWTDQGTQTSPPVSVIPAPSTPANADVANIPNNTGPIPPADTGNRLPFQDAIQGATFDASTGTYNIPSQSPNFTPISVRGNQVPGQNAVQ